jgi:hypothetical protein
MELKGGKMKLLIFIQKGKVGAFPKKLLAFRKAKGGERSAICSS